MTFMQSQRITLILYSIAILFFCKPVQTVHIFDVHRMFQMEKGTTPIGSQKATFSLPAATPLHKGSLSRHVVVMQWKEFSLAKLDNLQERNAEALLILLPALDQVNQRDSKHKQYINDEEIEKWRQIEQELVSRSFSIPIYFAWDETTIHEIYRDLLKTETGTAEPEEGSGGFFESFFGSTNTYQFATTVAEGTPIKEVPVTNFQGWLAGTGGVSTEGKSLPTLAIVAYYDTFAVAPGLARGSDSNGSGAVALLELARLFAKLYSNPRTAGKHNLLFVLTGAGSFNYEGSRHWLSNSDVRLLETIEFVLCLDTIGSGDKLYMHVSRLPKEENLVKLHDSFRNTAVKMGIEYDVIHKKINVSTPDIDWEHEQYSKKRIPAATLSRLPSPLPSISKSSVFDIGGRVNYSILERNVKFIAESLAKHIYNLKSQDLEVFSGTLDVNPAFIKDWHQTLSSTTRFSPLVPRKAPLLVGFEKALSNYIQDVVNQTFILESEYAFYNSSVAQLSSFRTKPYSFDMFLAGVVSLYLFILYATLKGPSETIGQISTAIFGKSKRTNIKKKPE